MDGSVEYTIPVWHPTLVHFPIALLIVGLVPAIIWCLTTDRRWLLTGWFIAVVGVAGTVAAYLTGDVMKHQAEGVPVVEALVGTHERFAVATLVASLLSVVAWTGVALADRASVRRVNHGGIAPAPSWAVRVLVLAIATASALLALRTGHIGGLMVWGVPVP